ncbi:hypothetical protein [Glycomyces salinus]|uniref:hypothetical protein n=1 Tax=Glycomyces salinus TaxID=980294 RepID=UPI0018ED376E|nr:hypothetical protein [Glycomyces salinus]
MYRIETPDLAHVRLDCFDFTVKRDRALPGVWAIEPTCDGDPGLSVGVFLAIRQAHHRGYTVWSTTSAYRQISTCNHPIEACDEVLRFGIDPLGPPYFPA